MGDTGAPTHPYVVKAAHLPALYFLDETHPRPLALEWINRGTDQKLRQTTIEMLLRTLFAEVQTPSVRKLHASAGLRASFRSDSDRARFARAFERAREQMDRDRKHLVTAIFDQAERAAKAVEMLRGGGVPEKAIAMLWRASEYLAEEYRPARGHSNSAVAGSIAGAGVAGALLGVGMLMIPGLGPVAVAGALAGQVVAPVAAVSGVIGATGGAIAKMLTDHDVDGVSATLFEREIRRGKVFLSVNTEIDGVDAGLVRKVFAAQGGHTPGEKIADS